MLGWERLNTRFVRVEKSLLSFNIKSFVIIKCRLSHWVGCWVCDLCPYKMLIAVVKLWCCVELCKEFCFRENLKYSSPCLSYHWRSPLVLLILRRVLSVSIFLYLVKCIFLWFCSMQSFFEFIISICDGWFVFVWVDRCKLSWVNRIVL